MAKKNQPAECPFCGNPGMLVHEIQDASDGKKNHVYYVKCSGSRCHSTGARRPSDASGAIAAWNRRVIDSA